MKKIFIVIVICLCMLGCHNNEFDFSGYREIELNDITDGIKVASGQYEDINMIENILNNRDYKKSKCYKFKISISVKTNR